MFPPACRPTIGSREDFLLLVAAGLRREYRHLDTVFVAHTNRGTEFSEPEFFQVTGTGGTIASAGFAKCRRSWRRASIRQCNVYLFYASDATMPRGQGSRSARSKLLAKVASYAG